MDPLNLDAPFNPSLIEPKWRAYWETHGFYKSTPTHQKKPFTITMPPPNITGTLTIGHMLYTLQDILIRWHRAQGYEACWIPGTDHASIATEARVTKLLSSQGLKKQEIGREAFLEHAWRWKHEYGHKITEALKKLGISCDWSRDTYTMDKNYSDGVIRAIVALYKAGLVYKSQRLVNWCPASQSVISDEEVNVEERQGHLWYIRYHIHNDPQKRVLIVATTRPETLFGDLAVAVNPKDPRYAAFIGQQVEVPLCQNRLVPVIADDMVEIDFGTGALKITPAHDKNDFLVGQRHGLGLLNILEPNGCLNQQVPDGYQGLDRFVARKKLVGELQQLGFLEKVEPHKLALGISERGGVPIEYYLSDQWYIRMAPLADLALNATRSGQLKFVPPHQEKVWEHWLTNIQDWCISRQLWWGHRLPMYTCAACGHVHCEEIAPQSCTICHHPTLHQDPDVLDTWASSWIWPFGVHNWAHPSKEQKQDLDYYYPTNVLITGPDIIFFWVARMVIAGEYFMQKIPFQTCYFTPLIRDAQGRKMSKSLGNSPDVESIMSTYGVCAFRFSLVNQVAAGQDIFWKDESCELGKNFCNKVWNAARYLMLNAKKLGINPEFHGFESLQLTSQVDDKGLQREPTFSIKTQKDHILSWVTSEFFATVEKAHKSLAKYEFSNFTGALYEFFWMVYCDWFLELIKPRLSDGALAQNKPQAEAALCHALALFDGTLRLLHPVMPFVTEELWFTFFPKKYGSTTLGLAPLPMPDPSCIDGSAIAHMRLVQDVVGAVRTVRGRFNIHPGADLCVYTQAPRHLFGLCVPQLESLSRSCFFFETAKTGFCASVWIHHLEIFVSLEGLVDKAAEANRLQNKIEKVKANLLNIDKKLANEVFVNTAPAAIVAGARKQQEENMRELEHLQSAYQSLK